MPSFKSSENKPRIYNRKTTKLASTAVRQEIVRQACHISAEEKPHDFLGPASLDEALSRNSTLPVLDHGRRSILDDNSRILVALIELQTMHLKLKRECCHTIPQRRTDIRMLTALRFPYFFEFGSRISWGDNQLTPCRMMKRAFRRIFGFDFEDLVAALEWSWDNSMHGGRSGLNSFELLWYRDLAKFAARHAGKSCEHSDALQAYRSRSGAAVAPHELVHDLMRSVYELERTVDYVTGYLQRIAEQAVSNYPVVAHLHAEVSPLAVIAAIDQPELIVRDDPACHAKVAIDLLEPLSLRFQPSMGHSRHIYNHLGGHDEFSFLLHHLTFAHIDKYESYPPSPESHDLPWSKDETQFLLALNILAWIELQKARLHLLLRLREGPAAKANKAVSDLIGSTGVVDAKHPTLNARWPQFFADDINEECEVVRWAHDEELGASFVRRHRAHEKKLAEVGLLDFDINPYARAFYCPQAWGNQIGSNAMTDAWIICRERLQTLDLGFAAPNLKAKEFKTALKLAVSISEMPIGPIADRVFACNFAFFKFVCWAADRQ